MPVDVPVAFNAHNVSPNQDPLYTATIGSVSRGDIDNGGIPITEPGQGWTSNNTNVTEGLQWEFINGSTSIDFTSTEEIFIIACQFNTPNRINIADLVNEGTVVRLYSSSNQTNSGTYNVGGRDTWIGKLRQGPFELVIDPQKTPTTTSGSYTAADVRRYAVATRYLQLTSGNSNIAYVTQAIRMGTTKNATNIPKVYGTNVQLEDLFTDINGTDYTNTKHVYVDRIADSIFFGCPFQFGKDGEVTTLSDGGRLYLSPSNEEPGDPRYHITETAMRVYAHSDGTNTTTLTLTGQYKWGIASPWDLSDALGTLNATFRDMGDFDLGANLVVNSVFDLATGSKVISSGANINGSSATGVIKLTTLQNLEDVTCNGLELELGGAPVSNLTLTRGSYGVISSDFPTNVDLYQGATGTAGTNVTLRRRVTILITVTDKNTGSPITDARVYLADGPTVYVNAQTNASGIISQEVTYTSTVTLEGWVRSYDLSGTDYQQQDIITLLENSDKSLSIALSPISN